jgi:hypothetical protein
MTTFFPAAPAPDFTEHSSALWNDAPVAAGSPPQVRSRRPGAAAAAGEFAWCMVGLAPAIACYVLTVTMLSVGIGLTVIWVGIPILVTALLVARAGGGLQRSLARGLLGLAVPGPAPIEPRRHTVVGWAGAVLRNGDCWRAVLYHLLNLVLAPIRFGLAIGCYAYAIGAISSPLWFFWSDEPHLWPSGFTHTFWALAVQVALGLCALWLAPRIVRVVCTVDRVLIAGLLGRRV